MGNWATALAALVPQVLALMIAVSGVSAQARRARLIERHVDLLGKLPDEPKTLAEPLQRLISAEVADMAKSGQLRLDRKVNKATLAAILFIAAAAVAGTWALLQVDSVLTRVLGVILALFGVLLILAGATQLYAPPRARRERQ